MSSILSALAKTFVAEVAPVLSRTSTAVGSAIDTQLYEGLIQFVLAAGAATAGSSPTLDVKITHCDTSGGTYTDVTGAAFTQVTSTAGVQKLTVDKGVLKRYVKASWTIGGTSTPTFPFGVILEAEKKYA